jgi:hypothetical protein
MTGRPRPRELPVPNQGSRTVPHPPHIARVIRGLQRQVRDATMRVVQSLLPVPLTPGTACTAAAMASVLKMWTYRTGASVFVDLDVAAGAGSVVSAQLACPDLGVTGAAAATAAGGEQVVRLRFDYPASWNPGDRHWIYVQAFRVSGTDATTCQVARAWQR